MFLPGSKVMVIESGVNKTTGAKRGSLGYFSYYAQGHYGFDPEFCMLRTKIVFTRYGFEEKARCEPKQFIAFVPINKNPDLKTKAFKKWAKKQVSGFGGEGSLQGACLLSEVSPKSTYYGILAPCLNPPTDLKKSDLNEWTSWITSIVLNPAFQNFLSKLHNQTFQELVFPMYPMERSFVAELMGAATDRGTRVRLVRDVHLSQELLGEFVRVVQLYRSVSAKHHKRKTLQRVIAEIAQGRFFFRPDADMARSAKAVQEVCRTLFTPEFSDVEESLKSSSRTELSTLAHNARLWKDLAPSFVE